jgi:hypothetical protein
MEAPGRLVAVDGVNDRAVRRLAKSLARGHRSARAGISRWDASGIFDDLDVAEWDAGTPSARTLLLLYAADLAFRLRWEIRPAVAEGRLVIAAPYVATAIAVGRAAGLETDWLADLFQFAPAADQSHHVKTAAARKVSERRGFVEFACRTLAEPTHRPSRAVLIGRASKLLRSTGS